MRSSTLAAALLLTLSASAAAAEMITPDPALSPQQVIKTQLSALQQNDIPEIDAGIAQAWALHDRWVDWYRAHKGEIKIPR